MCINGLKTTLNKAKCYIIEKETLFHIDMHVTIISETSLPIQFDSKISSQLDSKFSSELEFLEVLFFLDSLCIFTIEIRKIT